MPIAFVKPSASTNGRAIKIAATATPGTIFHTSDATGLDQVHMWLYNSDTVSRDVSIEVGGTTAPDDVVVISVPAKQGGVYAVPGWMLTGSTILRCFCPTTNVVMMYGYVHRHT